MTGEAEHLAPVSGRARIDVLDIMRGLAILGIYYMNVSFQAFSGYAQIGNPRLVGAWTASDRIAYAFIYTFLEGTQRALLEFLFGAGMMVLTARAMEPDGPVAVADLYFRRTLWLAAFGLFDIFAWLWTGDILLAYALAALPLFVFRKLGPKLLVALGSICAVLTMAMGVPQYVERAVLVGKAETAFAHKQAGTLTADDKKAIDAYAALGAKRFALPPGFDKKIAEETKAHQSTVGYFTTYWTIWLSFFIGKGLLAQIVLEAFCAMLIGIALWKWGVIQGQRSARFYAVMMVVAYAVGLGIRAPGQIAYVQGSLDPKIMWVLAEPARLAVGLGHLALINLAVKSRIGATILSPFKAAGRTAFSLYFLEQLIGLHILFSPYGFNLWGRFGWAGQFGIATGVFVTCLIVANIWTRFFAMGPLEWAWRSLAYLERQPFRKNVAA